MERHGKMTLLSETRLSGRAVSALKKAGVTTIERAADLTLRDLLWLPNWGVKSTTELYSIVSRLAAGGYSLRPQPPHELFARADERRRFPAEPLELRQKEARLSLRAPDAHRGLHVEHPRARASRVVGAQASGGLH